MPVTFPVSYGIDPKNFVQGPTRLWYAPYVPAGADAAQGSWVALGAIDKSGIEFDHKPTYADVEIDQSTVAVDSFLTKQEFDFKATIDEVSIANLALVFGFKAAALVGGTLSMGEPFDVQAGTVPSMRPTYWQVAFQFPSPGHDNGTSPAGAWGYVQLYKAFFQAHGAVKFSKDAKASVQATIRGLADFTVSGANKVGKSYTV